MRRSTASGEASSLVAQIGRIQQQGPPSPEQLTAITAAVAETQVEAPAPDGGVVSKIVDLALSHEPALADIGQHLLFAGIVEPLADSFEPQAVARYDALFSDVIDVCRRQPAARALDEWLARFGLQTADDLRRRRAAMSRADRPRGTQRTPQKILVLSRVTIGADVAITSVVLQRLAHRFPGAERCVVGGVGPVSLLGPESRAIDVRYDKRAGLVRRLLTWTTLASVIEHELQGLPSDDCLIVDPDSRLTQLGLLPVAPPGVRYELFESRAYRRPGLEAASELIANWMDATFDIEPDAGVRPRIHLDPGEAAAGAATVRRLRAAGAGPVACVNLGVGGNRRKRITDDFELGLLNDLLDDRTTVILDHGTGEEVDRVGRLVASLRRRGATVSDLSRPEALHADAMPQVLTYAGGITPFAALIAASDLYVGYDSAFQHIAAALGVPVIDVFVDPPNPLFAQRWRPSSTAAVCVIEVSPPIAAEEVRRRIRSDCGDVRRTRGF